MFHTDESRLIVIVVPPEMTPNFKDQEVNESKTPTTLNVSQFPTGFAFPFGLTFVLRRYIFVNTI